MNRVMTLGLALPALLLSSSALAGEPPFPAPRQVIVVEDDFDEDALREELREEIRREVEEQLEAERRMEDDVVVLPPAEDVVVVDTTTPIVERRYVHNISAGAGAFGFIADDLDFQDAVGPAWSVRYGHNLPILRNVAENLLTWEISYTGATDTDDGDVVMTATMLETGLKLNTLAPFVDTIVYPIITAGIGYGAFTRDFGAAGDLEDLGTLTLPLSAGLELAIDNFLVNGRATYRPVFFDEDELLFTDIGMDNWTIHGELGIRF